MSLRLSIRRKSWRPLRLQPGFRWLSLGLHVHVFQQLSPTSTSRHRFNNQPPSSLAFFSGMESAHLILLLFSVSVLSQACYRPFDDEWEMFTPARRYRGICRTKGHGCADACKTEGKSGGRCVLQGFFFWSCTCMCYRDFTPTPYTPPRFG